MNYKINNIYSNINFSIVMAYYNRKKQVIETLNRFNKLYYQKYSFEVIIIDDNSIQEEQLFDILNNYKFKIIYKFIDSIEKGNSINPCIVYNKGFSLASGKLIVIQNPECIHVTDIFNDILYSEDNINNIYLSIPVLSSPSFRHNEELYDKLKNDYTKDDIIDYLENVNKNLPCIGWYNHWYHRGEENRHLHFCTIITKKNLDKLKGFDENYSDGLWYDDNEFKYRVSKLLKIEYLYNKLVIHLYHNNGTLSHSSVNQKLVIEKNKQRYNNLLNNNL